MKAKDILFEIYKDKRTVFSLIEIAIITGETNYSKLNQSINYYVRTNRLLNLRKGIYAKGDFNKEELAGKIFKPSYISLEYVLQKEGVIFQYNSAVTCVSYLSRSIDVGEIKLSYRKIKNDILLNNKGISANSLGVNIACPERAFLDIIYLNKKFHIDNLRILDKARILQLLPLYNSRALKQRIDSILL